MRIALPTFPRVAGFDRHGIIVGSAMRKLDGHWEVTLINSLPDGDVRVAKVEDREQAVEILRQAGAQKFRDSLK